MHKVSRVYVANAGFKLAWFDGQLLPFTDLASDAPTHSIINLANQGGKTTLLALLLSVLDTDRRRFLQTISTPAHSFDDYFDKQGLPGVIAVEWRMPGDLASASRSLVTGQVVCMRKSGEGLEPERWFFLFETSPDFTLDSLPVPNLKRRAARRANSRRTAKCRVGCRRCASATPEASTTRRTRPAGGRCSKAMGSTSRCCASKWTSIGRKARWMKPSSTSSPSTTCVRRFLSLALDAQQADSVRELVAQHCRRMGRRRPLQEALAQMVRLDDAFAPFARAAVAFAGARGVYRDAEVRIANAVTT